MLNGGPLCFSGLPTAQVETQLKRDRYFHAHYRYYTREMRIRAYAQLLESYKSVTLASMAEAFGVTVDFIDRCAGFLFLSAFTPFHPPPLR